MRETAEAGRGAEEVAVGKPVTPVAVPAALSAPPRTEQAVSATVSPAGVDSRHALFAGSLPMRRPFQSELTLVEAMLTRVDAAFTRAYAAFTRVGATLTIVEAALTIVGAALTIVGTALTIVGTTLTTVRATLTMVRTTLTTVRATLTTVRTTLTMVRATLTMVRTTLTTVRTTLTTVRTTLTTVGTALTTVGATLTIVEIPLTGVAAASWLLRVPEGLSGQVVESQDLREARVAQRGLPGGAGVGEGHFLADIDPELQLLPVIERRLATLQSTASS